jgi:uncharacterized protein (TIGR02271 family)
MTTQTRNSVVGVFTDHAQAQRAVNELKRAGFTDDQIGVLGRDTKEMNRGELAEGDTDSYAGEGAATGIAAGAGIGALWGLGILAGALPAIGPAIAGGTLAVLLSSAAAGAAAAGLAGALIGMGIPKDEAEYYESEFKAGRILVTVTATGREDEARAILRRNGAYDATQRSALSGQGTAEGSTRVMPTSATGFNAMGPRHDTTMPTTAGMRSSAEGGTVKAVEEELHVRKTPVQSEVKVTKEVHTEHKTIDVPVTREEVVIERHAPTSGRPASAADIGEHQQIRIPVTEEQVTVEKTPVVKEEVSVQKRKVQDTERVGGTVRSEEIKVEADPNAKVCDTDKPSSKRK